MDRTVIDKTVSYIETNNMIDNGDRIIVGVSGGADSVCLLFLLYGLIEKYNLSLFVVHVHHGIRQEADEDAAFVEKLCSGWKIPYELIRADVPTLASDWKMSEEEAGRKVRYDAFASLAKKHGCSKIAVAHNMNDEAETVLFHMFRGSGIRGLTGMPAMRQLGELTIIRPILCLERSEIEDILNKNELTWVTDRTNLEDKYARNRIRHNILPEAEGIASGAVRHICEAAGQLAEAEGLLEELEQKCYEECAERTDQVILNVEKLNRSHPVIVKRVILRSLKEVTGGGKDIGSLQVEQVAELISREGNRHLDLARGVSADRSYGSVIIYKDSEAKQAEIDIRIEYLKTAELEEPMESLIERISDNDKSNDCTKFLDYDKMDGQLTVRFRKTGDYLMIQGSDGEYHRKSLKDYMIDAKIPSASRDKIPVVAVGSHCVWLVGYRISDFCKITDKTENIVKLSI